MEKQILEFNYDYVGWGNNKIGHALIRLIYEKEKKLTFVCAQRLNNETTSIINMAESISEDLVTKLKNPFEKEKTKIEKIFEELCSENPLSQKFIVLSNLFVNKGIGSNVLEILGYVSELIEKKNDTDFKRLIKKSDWVLVYPGKLLGEKESNRYFCFQYSEREKELGNDIHDSVENIAKKLNLDIKDLSFTDKELS